MKKKKGISRTKMNSKFHGHSKNENKDIVAECMKKILPYLLITARDFDQNLNAIPPDAFLSFLIARGILKNFDPSPSGIIEVVKILSSFFLFAYDFWKKPRTISGEIIDDLKQAQKEIEEIFSAIKKVGFHRRVSQPERDHKNAALDRFADSKKGFTSIKKKYLEKDTIYRFRPGHEKGDFWGAMMQEIILGKRGKIFGREALRKAVQNSGHSETDKK